jgi:hypothetical protein
MKQQTVTGVPDEKLCEAVKGFADAGAVEIKLVKKAGNWDITALTPD